MAEAAELQPPDDKTVARRVRHRSSAALSRQDDPDLIVDFSPLFANVGEWDKAVVPVAAAAIDARDGRILSLRVDPAGPVAAAADEVVAMALRSAGSAGPWSKVRVQLTTGPGGGWKRLRRELRAAGARVEGRIDAHMPMGATLRRTQGANLVGVPMRPRTPIHELETRVVLTTATTLSYLAAHLQRGLGVPVAIGDGVDRPRAEAAKLVREGLGRDAAIKA